MRGLCATSPRAPGGMEQKDQAGPGFRRGDEAERIVMDDNMIVEWYHGQNMARFRWRGCTTERERDATRDLILAGARKWASQQKEAGLVAADNGFEVLLMRSGYGRCVVPASGWGDYVALPEGELTRLGRIGEARRTYLGQEQGSGGREDVPGRT